MSAVISSDGRYRYRLGRNVAPLGDGACCFVMLNPSTADAEQDDNTIRRCIGYAKAFGCAQLDVVNLFAYRSIDPGMLYAMSRDVVVGPENDSHIVSACSAARVVICAWGNHGALHNRANEVLRLIRTPYVLKINASSGQPAHPLYLKRDASPIPLARAVLAMDEELRKAAESGKEKGDE